MAQPLTLTITEKHDRVVITSPELPGLEVSQPDLRYALNELAQCLPVIVAYERRRKQAE